jgi:GT2 family glycosyltransferase
MINSEKICIVLINHNNYQDTIECLESIVKSSYCNYQVVIIDNSEDDKPLDHLREWLRGNREFTLSTNFQNLIYPLSNRFDYSSLHEHELLSIQRDVPAQFVLIKSKLNKGFAAGNNIAIEYALKCNFHFVWLLNNDTVIKPDTLFEYMQFYRASNERIGIVGAKLFYYNDPNLLQAVGGKYFKWVGKVIELGAKEKDNGQWDSRIFNFDFVIGASMMVRTNFIREVGLMEEDYFLYCEELDWACRGSRKGWGHAFCHQAIVYHKQGASTKSKKGASSEISDFYSIRNRLLIAKRFFPYTLPTLYLSFALYIFNRLRWGKFDRIRLLFKVFKSPSAHFNKT